MHVVDVRDHKLIPAEEGVTATIDEGPGTLVEMRLSHDGVDAVEVGVAFSGMRGECRGLVEVVVEEPLRLIVHRLVDHDLAFGIGLRGQTTDPEAG